MRILIAHNAYQHRGGEDAVVAAEEALLRTHGDETLLYQRHNDELQTMPRAAAAFSAIWSSQSARELEQQCHQFQPDVIHAHNTFPLISPSIYWVAKKLRIPVVQTLHNFRLLCPQAMLLRDSAICEDCVGRLPWRSITRKCYRDSALQSAVLTGMLAVHRTMGTFDHKVALYVATNAFCRDKFIAGGLRAERLRIKPHFVDNMAIEPQWNEREGGLFIGRLSPEKGLDVLIEASNRLSSKVMKIVGNGPLEHKVAPAFGERHLGYRSRQEVLELLGRAAFLVAPSTCYETFGLVGIEAFSCGTPVIASRRGSFGELVKDGVTGLLFNPGDAQDLATKIEWALAHPDAMRDMGRAARAEYLARYTPQRNYRMLMDIYEEAVAGSQEVLHVA
jgi:glycosyltransferase involved in cell wall biosynthesis